MSKHFSFIFFSAIVIILFATCSSHESVKDAEDSANRIAATELAKRYNADDSWPTTLARGIFTPIITVELEKYWLTDRPILFTGIIKDIKTEDQNDYRLIVDYIEIGYDYFTSRLNFSTDLQLSIICSKTKIDSLINEHPNYLDRFESGVAIIADIDEIETRNKVNSEGREEEIRIGKGKCLDLIYIRNK